MEIEAHPSFEDHSFFAKFLGFLLTATLLYAGMYLLLRKSHFLTHHIRYQTENTSRLIPQHSVDIGDLSTQVYWFQKLCFYLFFPAIQIEGLYWNLNDPERFVEWEDSGNSSL